jgi:hypothetical protein
MWSIEIPTKQSHLQFADKKFLMRLLRGVYTEPVEVLAMTVREIFQIACRFS